MGLSFREVASISISVRRRSILGAVDRATAKSPTELAGDEPRLIAKPAKRLLAGVDCSGLAD